MSGQNRITVVLNALDKLSPVLKGIQNNTQGLGAGATFLGNMYTKAFETAAAAAGKLVDRFSEAADMQTSAIGLAGQFSAMTGKSYEAAGQMIKEMTADFSAMAAKLPGATQDYKNLGLAISDTLIKANLENGVFNETAFKKQTMSLAQTLGLLKSTNKELTTTDVQLFFTKFAEGASESELRILKLNERMPGLMGELEKASKKLYGDSKKITDLTLAQRTKVMEVATRNLAPPEMIKDLEKTAASSIEYFKTKLFDQQEGIFGFLRSVKTVNGRSKTVMDGFSVFLTEVLGEGGLFSTISKTLASLGLNAGDPMLALYEGLMTITSWARKAGDFLRGLTLPNLTKLSPERLGQIFADSIDSFFNQVGRTTSQINWGDLAKGLGDGIIFAGKAILAFLDNIDWSTYATAGLAILGTALAGFVITAVGGAIAAAVATFGLLPALVVAGVGLLIAGAATAITTHWGTIVDAHNQAWEFIRTVSLNSFTAAIGLLTGAVTSAKDAAVNAITSFASNVGSQISNMVSAISNWFSTQIDRVKSFIANPIGAVQSTATGQAPVTNHATGLNAGGLLSAIARETSLMPSGADVVIGNTSEVILNRSQQSDLISLVSGAMSRRGGAGTFAPQITINPSPGMDVNALANVVMTAIEHKWQEYQLASM